MFEQGRLKVSPADLRFDPVCGLGARVFRVLVRRHRCFDRPTPLGRELSIRRRTSQFDRRDWFVSRKP